MKIYIGLIISLMFLSNTGYADIIGVSSRTQLLQQLSLSLNMPVSDMNLPKTVMEKLPNTNSVDEIKPSFLASWTQLTYLGCTEAIADNKIKLTKDKAEAMKWIKSLADSSWGQAASTQDIEQIYNSTLKGESEAKKLHALACSMVLSSPLVYLKTNN